MTAVRLAEAGVPVDIFDVVAFERSPAVSSRAGVSAAVGDGDSSERHAKDVVAAGDGLGRQAAIAAMTDAMPSMLELLVRMGVPFDRTAEGHVALRGATGATAPRAACAGTTTGQELVHALERRLRRLANAAPSGGRAIELAGDGLVRRFERWDFLGLVLDDAGRSIGLVAQDLVSMAIRAFPYDAVALATGGAAAIFGTTSVPSLSDGAAAAAVYERGAAIANAEMVDFEPATFAAGGTRHAVADFVLAEGARLWLPKDAADARMPSDVSERERDYLVETAYPDAEGAVTRDRIAQRIFEVCVVGGRGIHTKSGDVLRGVYLDTTRMKRTGGPLGPALETAARLQKLDLQKNPLVVFPAASATLGGLWIDFELDASGRVVTGSPRNHATNIPGLYAVGEVACAIGGAGAIAGDEHAAALFGATLAAEAIGAYRSAITKGANELPKSIFDKAESHEAARWEALLAREGGENPYVLRRELGAAMDASCAFARDDAELDGLGSRLSDLAERAARASSPDRAGRLNQGAPFVRHLEGMIRFARVVTASARHRAESRGVHQKPALAARDDERWQRMTIALHREDGPAFVRELEYESLGRNVKVTDVVDTTLLGSKARPARVAEVPEPKTAGARAAVKASAPAAKPKKGAKEAEE
jgi:succinate dehydrogenase / fumarate reductase flavoprotein subunit